MVRKHDFIDEYYAGKDLSLLKKLTLVIPTYNRNYYLSRCLWYHAHFPFGEIIVADSSPEEKKVVNRKTVTKVREMFGANVLYLEYEPETEKYGGDIYRKWADAIHHSETEYSQICTDKEYLIPTTITICIEYLDKHSEYGSAEGRYYEIKKSPYNKIYSDDFYPGRSISINMDDPYERLKTLTHSKMDSYTLLAIRHTCLYNEIFNCLFTGGVDDLRFGELGFEMLSAISSKSIYLNELPFKFRDSRSVSVFRWNFKTMESSATRYPLINEYQQNKIYDECVDKLANSIYNVYIGKSQILNPEISVETFKNIVNIMIEMRNFSKPQSPIVFYLGLIMNYLPIRMQMLVKRILKKPYSGITSPPELSPIKFVLLKDKLE